MGATLRGIGWDHPRCSQPLNEAARRWRAEGRGNVEWTYRSLADFNAAPLPELARHYDLLVIDHPMLSAEASLLLPIRNLPAVKTAREESVGCCGIAYDWADTTLAVPIDVACHVSAGRRDLLEDRAEAWPRDWRDVLGLAERHPGSVLASLTGDDALCTLLTITASMNDPITAARAPSIGAVEVLTRLIERCPSICSELRPPAVLKMLADGASAYSPALFGYATYLRTPGSRLTYAPVPTVAGGSASGVMGGAGLAVSALSTAQEPACEFVEWIIGPSVQRDILLAAGGQPAAKTVWDDPAADAVLGGFLSQTREAIELSSVRMRHRRWPEFARRAARVLEAGVTERWHADRLHVALADLHTDVFADAERS